MDNKWYASNTFCVVYRNHSIILARHCLSLGELGLTKIIVPFRPAQVCRKEDVDFELRHVMVHKPAPLNFHELVSRAIRTSKQLQWQRTSTGLPGIPDVDHTDFEHQKSAHENVDSIAIMIMQFLGFVSIPFPFKSKQIG
jgi:hypothetical protein